MVHVPTNEQHEHREERKKRNSPHNQRKKKKKRKKKKEEEKKKQKKKKKGRRRRRRRRRRAHNLIQAPLFAHEADGVDDREIGTCEAGLSLARHLYIFYLSHPKKMGH